MIMRSDPTTMRNFRPSPLIHTARRHFRHYQYARHTPFALMRQTGRVLNHSTAMAQHIMGNTEKLVHDIVSDAFCIAGEAEALFAIAREQAATVSTAIRATPRFTRIFTEFVRIVADYRIHSLKARFLSTAVAKRSLEQLHCQSAERLYNLCVEMRGGMIKIGQFASTYVNALPPVYAEYLSRLQDKVPPVAYEAIAHRIESEFDRPPDQVFAWIDPRPIAAASLAQVHAAQLFDGTPVVVKVQMPAIEHTVDIDLTAFTITADIVNDLFPSLGLSDISRVLAASVRRELDYREELVNIRDFKRQTSADARVVVPTVYPAVSTRRILTMERLEGDPLSVFLKSAPPDRRDRILALLADSFCSQIISHGFFHADPHPGNIFVLPGDRLGLIDFGCVERFSSAIYDLYMQMIGAILAGDAKEMTRLFEDMGFVDNANADTSLQEMAADFMELMMLQPGQSLADVDHTQKLARGLELIQKYPSIRVPRHFVLLGRVLLTLGGIMMQHNPDIDVFMLILKSVATPAKSS